MLKLKNKIIVALDVDDEAEALKLGEKLGPEAGALKVGPRLTNRFGPSLVKKLSHFAPVFLDHKYYDIPSTMEGAVRAGFEMGASIITVHASSGTAALTRLAKVENELRQIRPFQLLAVTVLTSFKPEEQPPFYSVGIEEQVMALAQSANNCGIKGLVCSPHEIQKIRYQLPDALIVTPGVRSQVVDGDDQVRTMSADQAVQLGADYLVVGRPILQAKDSRESLRAFVQETSL